MPDPMTNLEMNDVLSSIRKLVSGDKDTEKTEPEGLERFVLTPAHRVDGVDPTPEDPLPELFVHKADTAPETLVPDPDDFEEPEPALVLDDATTSAVAEKKLDDIGSLDFLKQKNEEDAAFFRSTHRLDQVDAFAEEDASADPAPEAEVDPDLLDHARARHAMKLVPDAETPGEEFMAGPTRSGLSLEDRIAELEEAVGRSKDEWEPDGSEPEAAKLPDRHLFEVIDNTRNWAASPVEEGDEADEDEYELEPPEDLAATFAHRDAGRGARDKAPLQLADVATFSHVPPRVEEPETTQTPEPFAESELVDDDEDVFVDEDILKRVVAEVVREELQGKLGERMTRNIRRMVRREIEQTLSLKELE